MKQVNKDDLVRDLGIVAEDLEALVQATAHNASEKVTAIRGRVEQAVKTVKARLREVEAQVSEQAKAAAKEADAYVRENAWSTIVSAAKAGIFVGLMLHHDRKPKS
jgi:ElaB/YqjD/DUF883 family membrane-anchored ribosome-binding protein